MYLSSNLSTFSTTGEKEKLFSLSGITMLEEFSSLSVSKESKSSFRKSSKSDDFTTGSSWVGITVSSTTFVLLLGLSALLPVLIGEERLIVLWIV